MWSPVVIIGAARSGTNMLRDVLVRMPNVGTWPCDEINYIWRHGNVRHPSDVLTVDCAKPEVIAYIRRQFDKLASRRNFNFVVEKTCANSLRVDFVDRILPEAKYIYIVRDGRDVVASAMKRWKAELDFGYILTKARYVPVSDIPYYGSRYLVNRIYRLFSKEKRLASWGPRLDGMTSILATHNLSEVCAIQWRECVNQSDNSFKGMSGNQVHKLTYEAFVADPEKELKRICAFLGIPFPEERRAEIIGRISSGSVGKGHNDLGIQLKSVVPLMEETLKKHGYL